MPPQRIEELADQIRLISETLAKEASAQLPATRAKQVRKTIAEAYSRLGKVITDLDPVRQPSFIFDPSNPKVAGRIIALAMIAQPRKPLDALDKFYGSGVYALYYKGDFKAYQVISGKKPTFSLGHPACRKGMGTQRSKLEGRAHRRPNRSRHRRSFFETPTVNIRRCRHQSILGRHAGCVLKRNRR
jgi:hypothetical protein